MRPKPIDQQTTARTCANILACFLCVGHVVDTSAGDKSARTQDPAFWIENAVPKRTKVTENEARNLAV